MKKLFSSIFLLFFLASVVSTIVPIQAWGATYYVSSSGSNTPPYDTWAKAATAIQPAVNATTSSGDIVEIDGGTSGQTYNQAVATAANGVTIQGSSLTNHHGLVTITNTASTTSPLTVKHNNTIQNLKVLVSGNNPTSKEVLEYIEGHQFQ